MLAMPKDDEASEREREREGEKGREKEREIFSSRELLSESVSHSRKMSTKAFGEQEKEASERGGLFMAIKSARNR